MVFVWAAGQQTDRVVQAGSAALLDDAVGSLPNVFGVTWATGRFEHFAEHFCFMPVLLDHGKVGLYGDVLSAVAWLKAQFASRLVECGIKIDFLRNIAGFVLRLVWHYVSLTGASGGHLIHR